MFLHNQRSKWSCIKEKTIYGRTEHCVKIMNYFRFTISDSNYHLDQTNHTWDLPLLVEHTQVGLSSFYLATNSEYLTQEPTSSLIIKCNLLDRTMTNQHGVLEIIPVGGDDYTLFSHKTDQIGM